MNFMYLTVLAFGLLTVTAVKSESMFDYDHKVGMCGPKLVSMIYHICKYYRYTLDNINSQEKNVEKEAILNMCCVQTCLVKDIVEYCQDESRKRTEKPITKKPSRTELKSDITNSMIPNTPFVTDTLGGKSTNALKTNSEMNMASAVEPTQLGQQKVDTDLSKPLDIKPKDLSGTFLNIKFDVLHEKYTDKFEQ